MLPLAPGRLACSRVGHGGVERRQRVANLAQDRRVDRVHRGGSGARPPGGAGAQAARDAGVASAARPKRAARALEPHHAGAAAIAENEPGQEEPPTLPLLAGALRERQLHLLHLLRLARESALGAGPCCLVNQRGPVATWEREDRVDVPGIEPQLGPHPAPNVEGIAQQRRDREAREDALSPWNVTILPLAAVAPPQLGGQAREPPRELEDCLPLAEPRERLGHQRRAQGIDIKHPPGRAKRAPGRSRRAGSSRRGHGRRNASRGD